MNLLERTISLISPKWAAQRAYYRQIKNVYESAYPSRLRKTPYLDGGDPDYSITGAGEVLTQKARYLDANSDIATGALDALVARTVGDMVRTEPLVKRTDGTPATELNQKIQSLYQRWMDSPDITGELKKGEVQRIACRTWYRDGELLCRRLEGLNIKHNTYLPLSVQLLEIDHLRMDYTFPPNIVNGVEKDRWGKPVAYFVLPVHPGSIKDLPDPLPVRIPASEIIHPKIMKRIGQTRGVTQFHAVFDRLQDVNDVDLYERTAAKMGAAIGLTIERPLEYQPNIDPKGNAVMRERIENFWPGMVLDGLDPGETAKMLSPSGRPNPEITKFRHDQLRSAAAGLGISFSALSNVFDGNYSAQRQDMVQNESKIDTKTDSFISNFIDPIYKWAVEAMFLYGFLDFKLFKDVDLWTVFDAVHHGPALPWIDPQKEIEAKVLSVANGFKSRSQIIRENGDNPDAVRSEINMERQQDKEQGLSFGTHNGQQEKLVQDPSES